MNESRVLKAVRLATEAHKGQKDKAGADYILHPLTVAVLTDGGEDEKIVAILHDTLEDTSLKVEDIRENFGGTVADAVEAMTHRPGEGYLDYVKRLKQNKIARVVKKADLAHNSDLSRLKNPTAKDFARLEKYREADKLLGL